MAKTRRPPVPPPPPPPAPVETPSPQRKRKKKGRPSLLDLQRRSLRLQAQSPEAASPPPPARRGPDPSDDDEDAGGASTGRRRQKRLKNVLSGSGEEEEGAAVEEKKDAAKATGKGAAASSGGGPTGTPLPDKKLLLFILDRLQKKDTYGVYSDPVDPEELPDYHELIEHPMDFSTIREKLLSDKYTILEQFENDVFLLTSNAMSYNSEDTVYYRQARSIEALARKDFENLRQASDSEEEQPKTAPRRGRPPKNAKKTVEKVEGDGSPDLSNVKGNRSVDNTETRKRWTSERTRNNITMRDSSILHHSTFGSFSGKKTEKTGVYSGSSKYGKKTTILDDDRRSTYDQQYSNYSPLFSALDCERKQLIPIGLQQQHAYARSLARFAAKLGPIGWDIAAKGIRRVLPPGTKFGPGWVVDGEPPQNSQCPRVPEVTDPSAKSSIPSCGIPPKSDDLRRSSELSSDGDAAAGEEYLTKNQPVASTSAGFERSSTPASKIPTYENGATMTGDGVGNTRPTPPLQQQSTSQEVPSNINGMTAAPNTMGQYAGQGLFEQMTHAQVLGMFSGVNGRANGFRHGHQLTEESVKTVQNGVIGKAATTTSPLQEADHDPKGSYPQDENRSASPSLNAAGSPPRGKAAANPKQPDLVLQL
ncbi:uncharacterized protein [Aegilops tauschii subsp. strangulata]|uniref:uncharacterized protein n=1 Tax=Aegilops tauschii subsp. strangulata TaxID=200361 RepID=UPI00098BC5EA|nr:bromodomain-containing protein DDB_G0270170 [Aegilops tauschii subsp. strangulata]